MDCKFGSETVDEGDSGGRLQRISSKINHINGEKIKGRIFVRRGSAAGSRSSSSEEQHDQPPHCQRISIRIMDIIVVGAAESTTSSSEDQQQDQGHHRRRSSRIIHIDEGGSKEGSSFAEDQPQDQRHRRRRNSGQIDTEDEEDLHRQRSGAEVFYIHRYQVVVFLVTSISPHCNLLLFQFGVGSVWMCLNTGSSVLVDCKFGSETVDEEDSEGRLQRISSKIEDTIVDGTAGDQPHRRKRIKGRIFVDKDQQQDQPHHCQRFQENFNIVRRRKEGRPLRYQDLQNLKYYYYYYYYYYKCAFQRAHCQSDKCNAKLHIQMNLRHGLLGG